MNTFFMGATVGGNRKLGRDGIGFYGSRDTCPDTCPLLNTGCYGDSGPVRIQWDKADGDQPTAMTENELIERIRDLPVYVFVRGWVAGDIPRDHTGEIDAVLLSWVAMAIKPKAPAGFFFTHHKSGESLRRLAQHNSQYGHRFFGNVSADSASEADTLHAQGFDVALVIAEKSAKVTYTPSGTRIIACPADYKKITCSNCNICRTANRNFVVGFRAHGTKRKVINIRLLQAGE